MQYQNGARKMDLLNNEKKVCKICGEKLEKKDSDAYFYCMKCEELKGQNEELKKILSL